MNTYSLAGNSNPNCIQCPLGKYSNEGASECIFDKCPGGYIQEYVTGQTCSPCSAGIFYCYIFLYLILTLFLKENIVLQMNAWNVHMVNILNVLLQNVKRVLMVAYLQWIKHVVYLVQLVGIIRQVEINASHVEKEHFPQMVKFNALSALSV